MAEEITRRKLLGLMMAAPLAPVVFASQQKTRAHTRALGLQLLKSAQSRVVGQSEADVAKVKLVRQWRGSTCRSRLVNNGAKSVRIREVVLFDLNLPLPPDTRLFGEGFQMLSQTGGTLGQPADLGSYTDAKHYKMPRRPKRVVSSRDDDAVAATGDEYLFAFTSCRRFNGQFYLRGTQLQIVVDTEGLQLKPGETWELEEFTFRRGGDRDLLLEQLASSIAKNHKPLTFPAPPTGWCSWYCFGPRVTAQQVLDNLDFIARNAPRLEIHPD